MFVETEITKVTVPKKSWFGSIKVERELIVPI